MELFFDHGTIVVKDPASNFEGGRFTDFVWDARVERYRAPACRHESIISDLRKHKVQFQDHVNQSIKLVGEWKDLSLRPYQDAAIQSWITAQKRGLIVLPTGSGKTRVAMSAMAKLRESTLCLVPTRVLLEQWLEQLRTFYSGKIGIYGDGGREIGEITIATYESAYRNIALLGNRFSLLIVDEVHHFGNGLKDEIFDMITAPCRLGITGTMPKNLEQNSKLQHYIGAPVYELSISDLRGKYLAEFDLYSLHLSLTNKERELYNLNINLFRNYYAKFREACPEASWQDFVRFACQSIDGRSAMRGLYRAKKLTSFPAAKAAAVSSLLGRHRSQRVLVFTSDAETTYAISREHLIAPITSEIKRKEREESVARFKDGRIKSLVSCRVLNEGFDVPDAEVAIIVGGTHGEREHLQRVGRILRPSCGKRAVIYELICRDTLEVRQSKKRNENIATRKTPSIFN